MTTLKIIDIKVIQQIYNKIQQGESVQDLAKIYNLSRVTLTNKIKEVYPFFNAKACHVERTRIHYNEQNYKKCVELFNSGSSITEIQQIIKISKETIREVLRNHNVDLMKGRRTKNFDLINDITKDYVCKLKLDGTPVRKISKLTKVKQSHIEIILEQNNIKTNLTNQIDKLASTISKEQIFNALCEYGTVCRTAKFLNVAAYILRNLIRRYNIQYKSTYSKYNFTQHQHNEIIQLYIDGLTRDEIANLHNTSRSYIDHLLRNSQTTRDSSPGREIRKQNFREYTKACRLLSRSTRRRYGKEFEKSPIGWHWNHKYTILDGFRNNVPIEIISSFLNQELIPAQENLKQSFYSKITIDELYNLIKTQPSFATLFRISLG